MRMIFEDAPSGFSHGLEEAARLVGLQGDAELATLLSAASRNPGEVRPHRIFSVSPDAIASGESTAQAQATGWRCMMPLVPAVALELRQDGGSSKLKFIGVSMGPMTQGIADALAKIENDESSDSEMTPALLRLPSLKMDALWLKRATAAKGLVIPIALAPEGMTPGSAYTEAEFNRLTAEAANRLPTAWQAATTDDLSSLC